MRKRITSLLLVFAMLLSMVPTAFAADSNSVMTQPLEAVELYDGLAYGEQTVKNDEGKNVNTFVITVDVSDESSLTVATGVPNDVDTLTAGLVQTTSGQALAAQKNGKNVLAAVNADFFHMGDDTAIQPCSITIKDGVKLTDYYTENETRSFFFGMKEDGTAVIGDKTVFDEVEADLVQAVGGGPWLVKEGEVQEKWSSDTASHPRTAVGIKEDGSVLLVVADGRTTASAGMTYMELANYMKDLGAVEALNLDGGGSSAEVVKNPETYALEVKNSPSGGSERPVGNTLLVIDEDPASFDIDLEQDKDGYYLIKDADDFIEINRAPYAKYRLNNDIELEEEETISTVAMLSGEFDGNDMTISGLTVNGGNGYALFRSLAAGSEVYDLAFEDVNIATSGSAAALALECAGTVENVTVEGSIIGTSCVGGLVGYMTNGGQVVGCSAGVNVMGNSDVAGLVGKMVDGTVIENCYVNANVEGVSRVAGLVGYAVSESNQADSFIRNCIVRGTVKCTNIEGGGIGGLLKVGVSNCIVEDMAITATGTGAINSGNVAGLLGAWCNGSRTYTGNVIRSGSILAVAQCEAHRIGYHNNNKSDNYVYEGVTINGQRETGGTATDRIGADATSEQLTSKKFYEGLGFDFESVFDWDDANETPVLRGVDQNVAPSSIDTGANDLKQDADGYYLIETADDFQAINKEIGADYRLANDLDLTNADVESIIAFGGDFDGNGKTISNLAGEYALFGTLQSDGCIHDLTLRNVNIQSSGANTASLVGTCNGTVEDVVVTGKISGGDCTGGIVGSLNNGGAIRSCSVGVIVKSTGARVGGIVGFNDGTVDGCYANVNVLGSQNVGGVAGYSDKDGDNRIVRNCIVEGSVTATNVEPGGIGGLLKMRATNNIVKNMTIISTNSTTAPKSGNVAGLLGGWMKYSYGATGNVIQSGNVVTTGTGAGYRLCYNADTGTFSNNHASITATVNGQPVAGDNNQNAADATSEQLTSKEFYEGLGFDFERVFDWDDANKIPVLRGVDMSVTVPAEEIEQSNISLSVGADESKMNFTWHSTDKTEGKLLIAKKDELVNGKMPAEAVSYTATTAFNADTKYTNKVTATGLEADTTYAYQLVNGETASEIYTFTTDDGGVFSFAYVADPQIGASGNATSDTEGWGKTLDIVAENTDFSDISFMLSAGDQVNTATSESEYDGYLDHAALKNLPVATVIGNHDSGSNAYSEHFNVPNESEEYGTTTAGGDYWFVYNNVLFMVLNSNDLSAAEHKAFMQAAIEANPDVDWKIVSFHHSIYTVASHYHNDNTDRRETLAPIFDELDIDVVLQGHDHVYCRTYMMDGVQVSQNENYTYGNGADKAPTAVTNPEGVLYVTANSASGSKHYAIQNMEFPYSAVQNQEKVPNVSKVTVSDNQFTITTYRTTDMSVVDTFTIYRTADKPEPETGYNVTFKAENATVDVYNTQDYETPSETNATTALARDSKTGKVDISGNGQVNFKVNVEEGYELVSVAAAPEGNYKNLKDSADTGVDGIYRLTKVKGDVTVTITAKVADSTEPEEPTPTPTPGQGKINTESTEGLVKYLSSYATGNTNADGGVAEIVKFNEENDCMYLVSGQTQTLDIVQVLADGSTKLIKKVDIASLGKANGFSAGDITSVDVNTDRDLVAIAVQNSAYDQNGAIVTLNYDGEFVSKYDAGVQPDMVTFSPNGNLILSANEGEPREGYSEGTTDPKGSVTVVDLTARSANTHTFDSIDRETALANGVLLKKDTAPSVDLEPEFIAVSADSKTAYITLQENNAVAALDLTNGTWKYIKGLGFKDHSTEGNGLDLDQDNKIDIRKENVYGVYMPDGISVATINGQDYLITANEGDAREWGDYENISSSKLILSDDAEAGKKIEYLDTSKTDGLEPGKTYILGGRSFSIWNADTLKQVFDSGDDFETITAAAFPEYFNSGHDEAGLDTRSHKKGVEPESVSVLETNGKIYAIVGLERMGGIMVYDISAPANAEYADYLNVRDFAESNLAKAGDLGPEGICTISAENSPTGNAMILVANEVSGTVTVAQIEKTAADKDDDDDDSGSSGGSSSGGGAVSVSYAIAVEDATNGTVTTDRTRASYGSTVTLTVTPDTGYTLETLTVTTASGKEVELTNKGDGKYAFKMPGSKVAVKATFVDDNTMLNFFVDVSVDAYYYNAVLWAAENGITSGTTATTFSPDNLCTRAQMATFLWRAAGSPDPVGSSNPFVDVAADAYYAKAVQWAYEKGITGGTSATTFSPDQTCTRAQMATFLWHNAGSPETLNTTNPFADVPVNVYYATAVQWAYDNGITSGTNATAFSPNASCTRAQMVTFLYRCFAAK